MRRAVALIVLLVGTAGCPSALIRDSHTDAYNLATEVQTHQFNTQSYITHCQRGGDWHKKPCTVCHDALILTGDKLDFLGEQITKGGSVDAALDDVHKANGKAEKVCF